MPRKTALFAAIIVSVGLGAGVSADLALAQSSMQPSAPQKMMSPTEAQKMQTCEKQAADQNIRMDLRSKFVMDCMTKK